MVHFQFGNLTKQFVSCCLILLCTSLIVHSQRQYRKRSPSQDRPRKPIPIPWKPPLPMVMPSPAMSAPYQIWLDLMTNTESPPTELVTSTYPAHLRSHYDGTRAKAQIRAQELEQANLLAAASENFQVVLKHPNHRYEKVPLTPFIPMPNDDHDQKVKEILNNDVSVPLTLTPKPKPKANIGMELTKQQNKSQLHWPIQLTKPIFPMTLSSAPAHSTMAGSSSRPYPVPRPRRRRPGPGLRQGPRNRRRRKKMGRGPFRRQRPRQPKSHFYGQTNEINNLNNYSFLNSYNTFKPMPEFSFSQSKFTPGSNIGSRPAGTGQYV